MPASEAGALRGRGDPRRSGGRRAGPDGASEGRRLTDDGGRSHAGCATSVSRGPPGRRGCALGVRQLRGGGVSPGSGPDRARLCPQPDAGRPGRIRATSRRCLGDPHAARQCDRRDGTPQLRHARRQGRCRMEPESAGASGARGGMAAERDRSRGSCTGPTTTWHCSGSWQPASATRASGGWRRAAPSIQRSPGCRRRSSSDLDRSPCATPRTRQMSATTAALMSAIRAQASG